MILPWQSDINIRTAEHNHINQVVYVPKAIGHVNRQLNLSVGCFQNGIGQMVLHRRQYGIVVAADFPLKFHECFDAAMLRPFDPFVRFLFRCG